MARTSITDPLDKAIKIVDELEKDLRKAGKKALQDGDFDKTMMLVEHAIRTGEFKKKLTMVRTEFRDLYTTASTHLKTMARVTEKPVKRTRGKKTPEKEFRIPILEALYELGGKAKAADVLDKVYDKMKSKLNEYDLQVVPSLKTVPRWRHTAQMLKNKLMKEGLLKKGTERGIWEISDEGKKLITK